MKDERLINLETKLAYQEDLIQDLNTLVYQQQKRLDQLESAYRYLLEQSKTQADGKISDEKPPHY